jgi:hypothetical protein
LSPRFQSMLSASLLAAVAACTGPNPAYRASLEPPGDGSFDGAARGDGEGDRPGDAPAPGLDVVAPPDLAPEVDAVPGELPDLAADEASPSVEVGADTAPTETAAAEAPVAEALAPIDAGIPDVPPAADTADVAPPEALLTGPIGYWRFDEPDNARTVKDSSGHGNDGVFEGPMAGATWVAGHFGRGLELDMTDRTFGIRVAASPAIRALTNYTAAAWIYRRKTYAASFCGIISRQIDSGDAEVFNLAVARDFLKAYGPDRNAVTGMVTTASAPAAIPLNVWVHTAVTYDGALIRLYQDGVQVGMDDYAQALPATTTPLYLGTNKNSQFDEPFIGVLDEILLYDRALSPEAIAALAHDTRPVVP